jgi:hypothetical protein
MLRRIRGNSSDKFYQDLINKEPHVVSLTFWRDDSNLLEENGDEKTPQLLGIKIDKVKSEEVGERSGGDYQISALDDNPDTLLYGMPIEVGDLLVAVNSQSCYGLDIDLLKQMVATQTGIVTLTLRKTKMAPFQDELRLAVFIDSQKYTCIPKDICFFKEQEKLAIFSLYDQFDIHTNGNGNGNDKDGGNNKNEWLESSCLAEGQVVLDINGTPSFQLLEEEALALMQENLEADDVLAIKTYAPSRASTVETVDMVERISSYIVQLQLRMDRSLAQARNDNNALDYNTTAFPVFGTATQIEKTFLGSCNRCISVTNGKPLYRLYLVMEDVWAKYAKVLSRKFPQDNRFTKVLRKRLLPMEQQKGWFPKQQDQLNNQAMTEDDENETNEEIGDDPENGDKEETPTSRKSWFFSRKQPAPQPAPPPAEIPNDEATPARSRWFFSRRQPEDAKTEDPPESTSTPGWFRSSKKQPSDEKDELVDPKDKEANTRMTICHVLCTGHYCIEHLDERETKLKEIIDQKFKFQIDFDDTKQIFQEEVIAKGIRQLVHSVEFQLEPILVGMTRLKWHLWEDVGDTSPYAKELTDLLKKRVTSLSMQLPQRVHQKFKFDLVETLCEAYYSTLIKVHRISPVGTQQLLLDVCTLKIEFVALLQIPGPTHNQEEGPTTDSFDDRMKDPQGFVNDLLKKTEALLKLAGTNVEVDDLLGEMEKKPKPSTPVSQDETVDGEGGGAGTENEVRMVEDTEKSEDTSLSKPLANGVDSANNNTEDNCDEESMIVFDNADAIDEITDSERQLWRNEALADII